VFVDSIYSTVKLVKCCTVYIHLLCANTRFLLTYLRSFCPDDYCD